MTSIVTVALGVVAGISLCAALHHLSSGLSRPREEESLSFALMGLLLFGYALTGIFTYPATELPAFVTGAKWQMTLLLLFAPAFVWFTTTYTGLESRRFSLVMIALFLTLLAIHLASPFGILYSEIAGLRALTLPWGERYAFPEASANPWSVLTYLAIAAAIGFVTYACLRQYRRGERRPALILGASMAIFLGTAVYDAFIDMGLISSIYLLPFGFLALVIVMSLQLSRKASKASSLMQESDEHFRLLFEKAPIGMGISTLDAKLIRVNEAMCNTIGYAAEELIGHSIMDFTHPEDVAPNKELDEKVLRGEISSFQMEKRYLHKNGSIIHALLQVGLLRDAAGQPYRFVGQVIDMTEQKQAEAELRRHRERLEELVEERTIQLSNANERLRREVLEHEQARAEITHRNMELLTLQVAGAAIASSLDVGQTLDTVAEQMIELLGVDGCTVSDWDRERNVVSVIAESSPEHWYDKEASLLNYDLDDYPLTKHVLVSGEVVQLTISQPDIDGAELAIMQKAGIKSLLMLPLMHKGETMGLVELSDSKAERRFADSQISLSMLLANQAASAIQNARLFKHAENELAERKRAEAAVTQRVQELSTLNRIAETVSTVTELPAAMGMVTEIVTELFDAKTTTVHIVEGDQLRLISRFDRQEGFPESIGDLVPIEEMQGSREILDQKVPLVLADVQTLRLAPGVHERLLAMDIHATMIVPLRARGRVIGMMSVGLDQPKRTLTPAEVNLAETVAGYVTGAIETARLLEEEQKQRQVAESLREVATAVTSSLDQQEVLAAIFEQLGYVMHYDGACISLLDGESLLLSKGVGINDRYLGRRLPLSDGSPMVRVLRSNEAKAIPDTQHSSEWQRWDENDEIGSWMGAPLATGESAIGVLTVDSRRPGAYGDEDVQVLQAFADQAAIAIENARLYERAQIVAIDEERQRLARDLHDSVTQSLYSLTLLSNGWGTMAEQGRLENIVGCFEQLGEVSQQALKEMRLLIHQLRPPILEEVGIIGALQQRLDVVEQRVHIETRLLTRGNVSDLPHDIEEQLFHIAQEALNNALRHAAATAIAIWVREENGSVTLTVQDNGVGFDPTATTAGMGLVTMRERAEAIGGQMTISVAPSQGTTVTISVAGEPAVAFERSQIGAAT
jgi:PAS domain S-box-containing protein